MSQLVRQSKVIHTDDTTVPLLDPLLGQTRQARFWAYIGDRQHPYLVYDFTESRRRDSPVEWLKGFGGYLQADAYGGYDGLFVDPARTIVEGACWAHARRYWWGAKGTDAARAHQALGLIARLCQVETAARDRTSADRCVLRREHAALILSEFAAWLQREQPAVLPKSPIGEAFKYTQNQWRALNRYLEDGDLAIDNNVSERIVKIAALGRKKLDIRRESQGWREVVQWVESLVGVLTKIETEYGGLCELLEHPSWDEAQTEYFVHLLD